MLSFFVTFVLQNEVFVIAGPGAPSVFNCVRICFPRVYTGFSWLITYRVSCDKPSVATARGQMVVAEIDVVLIYLLFVCHLIRGE